MKPRREARELTLQCLYQCDMLNDWSDDSIKLFFSYHLENDSDDEFLQSLIFGTRDQIEIIDNQISLASDRWSISRMAKVDRNILRIACYEMGYIEDIPINVSINEAIEVAKRFAAEDSPMFINGILDNIARSLNADPTFFTAQAKLKKVG